MPRVNEQVIHGGDAHGNEPRGARPAELRFPSREIGILYPKDAMPGGTVLDWLPRPGRKQITEVGTPGQRWSSLLQIECRSAIPDTEIAPRERRRPQGIAVPPGRLQGGGTVKATTVAGVAMIAIGILALDYDGIHCTQRGKVLDIGPLQATTMARKTIPVPPILDGLALAGGIVVLIAGTWKS